ncbi:hypothetical protein ACFL3B_01355 [Gemmatimonadota bacterium]
MPAKKPPKKSPGKKPSKKQEKGLKDADLDSVVGGVTDVPTASIPLEELDSRKRPGRVKSLQPNP